MANITLFAQVIAQLPKENIKKIIREAGTDKHCKGYDTWSQFVSMVFCQFSHCDSVRDISNGLHSATGNLNHLGIRRAPSKSTVAYQNAHRDSEVFKKIFFMLYQKLGQQGKGRHNKLRLKIPIKLLDSTLVSLTLSLYDWAHYKSQKGAVKMHTMLDYDSLLPEYVYITDGKCTDNKAAVEIPVEPYSIVVADRGYCDYFLLNYWDSTNVFFVVRHKENIRFRSIQENPLPEKRSQEILVDQTIEFELDAARRKYPRQLRRIAIWNDERKDTIEILTNNFKLAASTIAKLYMARWKIEIFFRSLKQLLRIKSFIGTSRNAVEIQIWTALTTILILTWLKNQAKYKWGLANLVVSLRLNTFTKIDLEKWLNEPFTPPPDSTFD